MTTPKKLPANNEEIYAELGGSAKDWADEQVVQIDKGLRLFYFLMALSFFGPLLSLPLRPSTESFETWAQRAGAIMVVIALLAEIKINALSRLAIKHDHTFLYCHIFLKNKYEKRLDICNYLTFIFISAGTVVWGYGDVLLKVLAHRIGG
jgi:hypothetical protein